jgi:hypothetical protein
VNTIEEHIDMVEFKCPSCWERPVTRPRAKLCDECRAKCVKCKTKPRRSPNESYCRECKNIRERDLRRSRNHRSQPAVGQALIISRARSCVSTLLRRGKLVAPLHCQHEGCEARQPIAYFKDPSKWREIDWLCRQHAAVLGFIQMPKYPSWLEGAPSTPEHQAPDANQDDRAELPPQS